MNRALILGSYRVGCGRWQANTMRHLAAECRTPGTTTLCAARHVLPPRPSPRLAVVQGREKIRLIKAFVDMGFETWVSDVDAVFLRDPLPLGAMLPAADILVSTDHLSTTVRPGDLVERWPEASSAANIGIMFVRRTAARLIAEWEPTLGAEPWDQNAFNLLLFRDAHAMDMTGDNLFK